MHQFRHHDLKSEPHLHVLWKRLQPQCPRQLLLPISRVHVHSYWRSLNRELIALNLQLNKYRDVAVAKLNPHQ